MKQLMISQQQAQGVSAAQWGIERADAAPTAMAAIAASLRLALWLLSGGTRPVHINALMPAAETFLESFSTFHPPPDDWAAREALHDGLDELELLGDVAELPRGRWLPSPLRLVALPDAQHHLLVGGRPSSLLLPAWRSHVKALETSRLVARLPTGMSMDLPLESLEDWLRLSDVPLASWTRSVMETARWQAPGVEVAELDLYAPAQASRRGRRGNWQHERWIPLERDLPDGRYLARTRRFFPDRYRLVEIRNRRVEALAWPRLEHGGVRRLMYGLDLQASAPVSVRLMPERGGMRLRLENELPGPEQRLMTALGVLSLPEDGKYYPRDWWIPAELGAEALRALEALGVRLEGRDR